MLDEDRGVFANGDDCLVDVVNVLNVACSAEEIFHTVDSEVAGANFLVRLADGIDNLCEGYLLCSEFLRIDIDLVLFLEAADGGDLGDAICGKQRVADLPILDGA